MRQAAPMLMPSSSCACLLALLICHKLCVSFPAQEMVMLLDLDFVSAKSFADRGLGVFHHTLVKAS